MTGEERKKLRDEILQELYDHHFSHSGASFNESKSKLRQNPERNLAIKYLIDKGYVRKEEQGLDNLLLFITTHGIDYIESK